MNDQVTSSPLGKASTYQSEYSPSLLFPIQREDKRKEIGIVGQLPFYGEDLWNAYELSWLNEKGKPEIAIGEFRIPCDSPYLIESKSLKLYLNSLNQSRFRSMEEVEDLLIKDLSQATSSKVIVKLQHPVDWADNAFEKLPGDCIDVLDIEYPTYCVKPNLLKCSEDDVIEEKIVSHLLKSNCLVTGQPDWGSLYIHYRGPKIDHVSLLEYIISFRQHNEFHEQCIERIFMDLKNYCHSQNLSVYGRYTRRGGLDINPFRSNFEQSPGNIRLPRQ